METAFGVLLALVGLLGMVAAYVFVWWLPNRLVPPEMEPSRRDHAHLLNSVRTTWAQVVGGAFFGITALATAYGIIQARHSMKVADSNLEIASRNLELARQGETTDRFYRAVEHLGGARLESKVAGVYALEQIARDPNAPQYREPILELLAGYV